MFELSNVQARQTPTAGPNANLILKAFRPTAQRPRAPLPRLCLHPFPSQSQVPIALLSPDLPPEPYPSCSHGDRGARPAPPAAPPLPVARPILLCRLSRRRLGHPSPRRRIGQGRRPHRARPRHRPRRRAPRGGRPLRADPPPRARQRGAHRAGLPPPRGDRRVLRRVRGPHRAGVARQAAAAVLRGAIRAHPRVQEPRAQQARAPGLPGRPRARAAGDGRRRPRAQAVGHPVMACLDERQGREVRLSTL
ncbi:hypothetical protein PVAP13_2NG436503 [Panicum virgatum]|uniref:Uncharacterized protein n=1 Tax=Panicum virgatum TaxID=38727 RepID=A0A8T0VMR1_PANVG|nr:hypothetical protein PVAP13_2NG436503 [Panicum virgatum]